MNKELKESIIILNRIKNQLNNASDGIIYLIEKKDNIYKTTWDETELFRINTSLYGLINYSFIWYCCFLDEYSEHFTPTKDVDNKDKIIAVRSKCKKFLTIIKEIFGDIKTARNTVLAHGYRHDKGKPLSNEEINQHFNQLIKFASIQPYTQLSNIVNCIVAEIDKEFGMIDEKDISLQEDESVEENY